MECGAFIGDGLTKYIQTDAKWIKDAKFGRNNSFEIKNETEDQVQQKINRDLNSAKMPFLVQIWKYWLELDKLVINGHTDTHTQ